MAVGAGKAGPVALALTRARPPKEIPVQLARAGCWFLDRAAAARLPERRVRA